MRLSKAELLGAKLAGEGFAADKEILVFNFHGKLNVQDVLAGAFVSLARLTKFHTFRRKVVGRVERFDVHHGWLLKQLAVYSMGGMSPPCTGRRGYWLTISRFRQ